METLVIVDFQKDFASRDGSLYVPGAEKAEAAIIDYISKNHNKISDVMFTVDWHSPKHCSFVKNGGQWPAHCVQFTEGAGISGNLMRTCMEYDIYVKVFKKGTVNDCEEYGAFEYINTRCIGEDDYVVTVNNVANKNEQFFDTTNIVVCGLAGDYCVQETIKNLLRYNGGLELNISALKDGIASIDGGVSFNSFAKEANLTLI